MIRFFIADSGFGLAIIAAALTAAQSFTAFAKGTASTITIYGLVKKGTNKAKKK